MKIIDLLVDLSTSKTSQTCHLCHKSVALQTSVGRNFVIPLHLEEAKDSSEIHRCHTACLKKLKDSRCGQCQQ